MATDGPPTPVLFYLDDSVAERLYDYEYLIVFRPRYYKDRPTNVVPPAVPALPPEQCLGALLMSKYICAGEKYDGIPRTGR